MVAQSPRHTMTPGGTKRWSTPFEDEVKPTTLVSSECRQLTVRKRDQAQDATPPLLMYVGKFIDSLFNPEGPSMMKVATACMQDTSLCTLADTTFEETVDWKSEVSAPEWLPDIIMHTKGEDDVSMDLTFDGSYMIDPRSKELLGIQQSGKRVYRLAPRLDVPPGYSKKVDSAPSDENSLEPPLLPSIVAPPRNPSPVSTLPSSYHPSTLLQHKSSILEDQQSESTEPTSSPLPTNTDTNFLQQPKPLSESSERQSHYQTWTTSNLEPSQFKIVAFDDNVSRRRMRGIWPINRNRRSSSKDPAAKGRGRFRFSDRRSTTDRATSEMYPGNGASSDVTSTRNDVSATRSVGTQSIERESIPSSSPSIYIQDSTPSLDRPSPVVVVLKNGRAVMPRNKSDKLTETSPLGLAILQNISSSDSDDMQASGSDVDCKASSNTDQAQGSARRRIRRIFSKDSAGSSEKRASLFSKGKALLLVTKKVEEKLATES